jgi:hypothetical protein
MRHPLGSTKWRFNMKSKLVCAVTISTILLCVYTGCEKSSPSPTQPIAQDTTGQVVAYKPNIYIYPQVKSIVSIKLEFPLGGTMIESIPTYSGEWRVEVEPTGKIDGKYDYLFYECQNPDAYQYHAGWILNRDSLSTFFMTNLFESGFSEHEIRDFTDYWVPRLINYRYYFVYPQYTNDIDQVIKLQINKTPDKLLRLFYVIQGSENNIANLHEPIVPKFTRTGFVVTEWGVVLK